MFKDFEAAQARRESAKISRKKTMTTIGLMLASFVLGWNHLWLHSPNHSVNASAENAITPVEAQHNASLSVQPTHDEVTGAVATSTATTSSAPTTTAAPAENPNQVSISLELPKPEPITAQTAAPATSEPGLNTPIVIPDPSANNMTMPAAPQASGEVE